MNCSDLAALILQAKSTRDRCHSAALAWQAELALANANLSLAQAANPPNPNAVAQWTAAVAALNPIITCANIADAAASQSVANLEQIYAMKGCP